MVVVMCVVVILHSCMSCFFFQAEDGIRYLVRSRGLGDVYKRQEQQHMYVNLSVVIFTIIKGELLVLLVERSQEPFLLSLIHI